MKTHQNAIWLIIAALLAAPLILLPMALAQHPSRPGHGPHDPPPEGGPHEVGPLADEPSSPPEPVDEETEDEVMRFLKQNFPEFHRRVESMRQRDPRRYRRAMAVIARRVGEIQNLPEEVRDAKIEELKLRAEIFRTAFRYRMTRDEEKKSRLRHELEKLIAERFDAELVVEAHRLKEMEKRLEELQKKHAYRKAHRDEVVSQQLETVLKRAEQHPRRRNGRWSGEKDEE